jgi:hypothetical protein
VQKNGLIANVIIDGKILANNLNAMNKTRMAFEPGKRPGIRLNVLWGH